MAFTTRLERLRNANQSDLDALPDREPEPIVSDSDSSGGVTLDITTALNKPPVAGKDLPDPLSDTNRPNTERRFIWLGDAESSYKPTLPKPHSAAALPSSTAPLACTDLNRGDLGSATQHYSPIVALCRYPYRWCNNNHSQDIASAFFDQGKFWEREWDLYVETTATLQVSLSPSSQLLRLGH